MRHFIILDAETGGLDFQKNPITQIAAQVLHGENFNELERLQFYVQPYMPLESYEEGALNYTQITIELLNEKGIPAEEGALQLARLFDKYKTGSGRAAKNTKYWPILVGHNLSAFDKRFIWKFLKIANLDLFDYVQHHTHDTQIMMGDAYPTLASVSLNSCCEQLGIVLDQGHDAMADVIATGKIFQTLIERLRNQSSTSNEQPTIDSRGYVRNFKFNF